LVYFYGLKCKLLTASFARIKN